MTTLFMLHRRQRARFAEFVSQPRVSHSPGTVRSRFFLRAAAYREKLSAGYTMKNTAILLIDCPDQKGIVASVSEFLFRHQANILHADQHQDGDRGLFLTRVEWDLTGFGLAIADFGRAFAPVAEKFQMRWRLELSSKRQRVAIFVSKYDHCLADLLYRHESEELDCEIPLIISNHRDAERLAGFHRIPFHVVAVEEARKAEGERRQLALLEENAIDLVVLARYMQILSAEFVARYPQRIINVHHSFLPGVQRGAPVSARLRAWGKIDRRDQSLCDGDIGRGADHRAGRRAHFASRPVGRPGAERARSGEGRVVARGAVAYRAPDSGVREENGRVRLGEESEPSAGKNLPQVMHFFAGSDGSCSTLTGDGRHFQA